MKKKKLGSKNPKYLVKDKNEQIIHKKIKMCDAIIRTAGGKDTGRTAAVYGVWYE